MHVCRLTKDICLQLKAMSLPTVDKEQQQAEKQTDDASSVATVEVHSPAGAKKKKKKYKPSRKFKKAPQAPKRFKTAFILFSASRQTEIRSQLREQGKEHKVRVVQLFGTNNCHVVPLRPVF